MTDNTVAGLQRGSSWLKIGLLKSGSSTINKMLNEGSLSDFQRFLVSDLWTLTNEERG